MTGSVSDWGGEVGVVVVGLEGFRMFLNLDLKLKDLGLLGLLVVVGCLPGTAGQQLVPRDR